MSVDNKSGFTLIEVLIAVVIISMMMIGLQQVLGTTLSGYEATKKKHDLMARARFAMGRMVMFVQESGAITNPGTGPAEEILKVSERKFDTYNNSTHAYDIDGDGLLDADNDVDGFVNEGPADEDPVENITFYLDKTDSNNWKLMEEAPAYSTVALDDYMSGRVLCEYVTLFQCEREDKRVEIRLTLDDNENRVSLKTTVRAGRWPEALPRGAFPQLYFYIADTDNHRLRKVDGLTGIITTVAGTGNGGYFGDGGLATNADLNKPRAISVDGSGNIYIADTENHRLRKVDGLTGIITTVAGTGNGGYFGDGGLATNADLNKPRAISVDGSGNIYIADTENHRLRKVDGLTGIITTVAGTGNGGYFGDGGLATNADLNKPRAISVDGSGNIYIADTENHRLRKVDGLTGIITTVAGTGNGGYFGDGGLATNADLNKPRGISVDGSGNIYIADTENHRLRKVDGLTGIITTVAGTGNGGYFGDGGLATNADLNKPRAISVDGSGNIYIADTENHRLRKVDAALRIIVTVTGTGSAGYSGDDWVATNAEVNMPRFIFVSPN